MCDTSVQKYNAALTQLMCEFPNVTETVLKSNLKDAFDTSKPVEEMVELVRGWLLPDDSQ